MCVCTRVCTRVCTCVNVSICECVCTNSSICPFYRLFANSIVVWHKAGGLTKDYTKYRETIANNSKQ